MNARAPKGDKIATSIFRAIIFCLGVLLLIAFSQMWNKVGIKGWMTFGTLIGLFMGYGLGGDIWGARCFDLFTGQNSEKNVGAKVDALSKMTMFVLVGILVIALAFVVLCLWIRQHSGR